ncbi:FecR domain-containing protein [Halosquirtibacter xylanolyticus]|uniref:FecR family protein n=1 Tax=Halosquirtibacter xylanolyticus TaxID=3374599 RepID=UPI003748E059|nr:FecR domain-containing protein [Prolixibacteraceae bacterium]
MSKKKYYKLKSKSLLGTLTKEEEKELSLLEGQENSSLDLRLDALTAGGSASKRVERRVLNEIRKNESLGVKWWLTLAASVLLFVGMFKFVMHVNMIDSFETYANNTEIVKKIVLKDRSIVTLNKGAFLELRSDFSTERRVHLLGEAMFQVYHDGRRPFVVEGEYGQVEVLGTTFVVDNSDSMTMATLVEGSIAFDNNSSNKVVLKPNQQAVVDQDNKIRISEVKTSLSTSWVDGQIRFKEEDLSSVVQRIGKEKDVVITISDSLKSKRVSGVFEISDTVESMLYALTKVTKTNLKKDGSVYVIE